MTNFLCEQDINYFPPPPTIHGTKMDSSAQPKITTPAATHDIQDSNIKEGYMFVQSNSVWRPWAMKAKYFILTKECLYCYKRRGDLDAIPCDVIPLNGAAVTIDDEKRGMRKRYYIRMTSTHIRKSFNLFCFAVEERNAWLTCILSALAKKYTDKGFTKKFQRKSGKTYSLGECESGRRHQLDSLEQTRHMSISCLELTNLSVMMDPLSPTRSVIPIRKTFEFAASSLQKKKISSSSLDIAIRTDITLNRREIPFAGSNSITPQHPKPKTERSAKNSLTMSCKRHKSMSDLLSINSTDYYLTLSPSSEKKKRKSKGLSLGMLGGNLNFKTMSISNLNRLK